MLVEEWAVGQEKSFLDSNPIVDKHPVLVNPREFPTFDDMLLHFQLRVKDRGHRVGRGFVLIMTETIM